VREHRRLAKLREAVVLSDRMDQTVVVIVERLIQHPKYRKYIRVRKKFKVHDAGNKCQIGDRVVIRECRPLSKDKRWKVMRVLAEAERLGRAGDDSNTNDS
jgi:small subunit ribosomal protein S17